MKYSKLKRSPGPAPRWLTNRKALIVICSLVGLSINSPLASAEITTDGSVGPALILNGPDFQIDQAIGTRTGNNLFHSFQSFNLNSQESATFTGDNAIQNVISRVIGGGISTIDGLLRSEVGQADFYFINPAGIVFGNNAQIDVPAAFYASTAARLNFADGASFDAINPQGSQLTMATPDSFGFTANQTGSLVITANGLAFRPNTKVNFNSQRIDINGASISGEGLQLQILANGAQDQNIGIQTMPDRSLPGDVNIQGSNIDISGNGTEQLQIRGGSVSINDSSVNANNQSDINHIAVPAIDLQVDNLLVNNSLLTSDALAGGDAGSILINSRGPVSVLNGGNISSDAWGSGNAGSVTLNSSGLLSVLNNGGISSTTFAIGNGGTVEVNAAALLVDGFGSLIAARASETSEGNAGSVMVNSSGLVSVLNGGGISSETFALGNAGTVNVTAGNLMVNGLGNGAFISSSALENSEGSAGSVTVTTSGGLSVLNGGNISSDTLSIGNAGPVTVNSNGRITLSNEGRISSRTIDAGNAGSVTVNSAGLISVLNEGWIDSSTFGIGNAGIVSVSAGELSVNGVGSFITSSAFEGSGNAGSVMVKSSGLLSVLNGGQITSSTFTAGNAGTVDVTVTAGDLLIDGQGIGLATGIATFANSGSQGDAGTVTVNSNGLLSVLNGGWITSNTFSLGNAGTIVVNAPQVLIDGQGTGRFTGIASGAEDENSGLVGSVILTAQNGLTIANGGALTINSWSNVQPLLNKQPQINVSAPRITLSGGEIAAASLGKRDASQIFINSQFLTLNAESRITTLANVGNGGTITLNGTQYISLLDSLVETSVLGVLGNGGDINIATPVLVLDAGFIQANTAAVKAANASGGNINLAIESLIPNANNLIIGGLQTLNFNGRGGLSVIQAVAPNGVNGNINNTAPELNITNALASIDEPRLNLDQIGKDPCSPAAQQNTLKSVGLGAVTSFKNGQDQQTIEWLFDFPIETGDQAEQLNLSLLSASSDWFECGKTASLPLSLSQTRNHKLVHVY